MKTVNDFTHNDCFIIKDTSRDNEVLGLQLNIWGEHDLSDKYGSRPVLVHRMESAGEIYGYPCIDTGDTLVLYI